jgi:O-acetyl-ADP-ribose deacetylase (regulator of RNase III)
LARSVSSQQWGGRAVVVYVQENLFTSPARVLVNTVNTVGVMGKGIAKTFRDAFPEMYEVYRERCERGEIAPGVLQFFPTAHKGILNFPTKRDWRHRSRLADVEAGLKTFVASYADLGLTSVAFPQLGCGHGGLDWDRQVRPLMARSLDDLPIDVYVHVVPPGRAPSALNGNETEGDELHRRLRVRPEPVAFDQFCADLLARVPQQAAGGWRIGVDDAPPALVFARIDAEVAVAEADLFDLWRRLHGFGLLAPDDLEPQFGPIVPVLFDVLTDLPYVERVVWAMDPSALDSVGSRGLLYVPPTPTHAPADAVPRQAGLFAEVAVA